MIKNAKIVPFAHAIFNVIHSHFLHCMVWGRRRNTDRRKQACSNVVWVWAVSILVSTRIKIEKQKCRKLTKETNESDGVFLQNNVVFSTSYRYIHSKCTYSFFIMLAKMASKYTSRGKNMQVYWSFEELHNMLIILTKFLIL